MRITSHLKEEKYVAFLDVLGFKKMVEDVSDDSNNKLNIYFDTIWKTLQEINSGNKEITSQLISDSIILACDLTHEHLRILLRTVQAIQAKCSVESIWLRGAITKGPIHFDNNLKIVVGNGLSEAYLMESQEKFPRVIIDPKVLNTFGTRTEFINLYNGYTKSFQTPLIYDYKYSRNLIENDAIFVAFAEKIAIENSEKLEVIYNNIKRELYSGQKNYLKYFWLKNYFSAVIMWLVDNNGLEIHSNLEKSKILKDFADRFSLL